jgi:AraC-like DNA-binding protein
MAIVGTPGYCCELVVNWHRPGLSLRISFCGATTMQTVVSAQPQPDLRPFVRAYAQRVCKPGILPVLEFVPAQLEQVLNFEFGTMPGIHHQNRLLTDAALVGGAQSSFSGYLELRPGVESFAIFFQPAGFSALFGIPLSTLSNQFDDATAIDPGLRSLWNRLGESRTFESRISIVEQCLLGRAAAAASGDDMAATAQYLFRRRGAIKISALAHLHGLGLRHFERGFKRSTGLSPKTFARIARFQAALDAKAASPKRTWLEISHSFGYYDQMHMVHDFESLGRNTPTNVIAQMGDVRPTALITEREGRQEKSAGRRN